MKASQKKIYEKRIAGFSLAEALITLLIICVVAIASAPVITKKHRAKLNLPHGAFACYWDGNQLISKYVINGEESDGKVIYDNEEGRYGCEFNPPVKAKNFVATIVGGGGGGSAAIAVTPSEMNRVEFTTPGNYTYTIPETGRYSMLAVGGGGGGGDSNGANGKNAKVMGGSGTTGGVVYIPDMILKKNTKLNLQVGQGGAGSIQDGYAVGSNGKASYIRIEADSLELAYAGGGGGGASIKIGEQNGRNVLKAAGWDSSRNKTGIGVSPIFSSVIGSWRYNRISNVAIEPIDPNPRITWGDVKNHIYSYKAEASRSDLSTAQITQGADLPSLGSDAHQGLNHDYTLISALTNYNTKFFKSFNLVTRNINGGSDCASGYWNSYGGCKYYADAYGAGGKGSMFYHNVGAHITERQQANSGQNGYIAIVKGPVYAGLGGGAGKTVQIPYADMPQKSLLFPGKGGKGGTPSPNVYYSTTGIYYNTSITHGDDGEDSFIKNGSHILGGTGADDVDPLDSTTYSTKTNSDGSIYAGNGDMADVLTSKKTGTGGLGGLNSGNTSIDGTTQTVFKDSKTISNFNDIYGAGSGGGGGTVSAESSDNVDLGYGAQGSSGLVFIQW